MITPALKGAGVERSPVILLRDCTNCGRCIDICPEDVFRFALRGDRRETDPTVEPAAEVRRAA